MVRVLVVSIMVIGIVFFGLTFLILANKVGREFRDGARRARRRLLEPIVLAWAHGEETSLTAALGGAPGRRDRAVLEEILLDHVQRIRGVERGRLGRALDELGLYDRWLERLSSRRWWARADAAEKLGLSGATRAADALARLLDDDVAEVRLRAAKALASIGGRAAVRPLIETLRDPDRWSSIRVADILASAGREVPGELQAAWPRLAKRGRLAALDIVGRIRPVEAVPWLVDRTADVDPDVRARACHALGAIGDPSAGKRLVLLLREPEWPVRAMAAKALGRIRFHDAVSELCHALRDREWWVRANAAEALKQVGPEGVGALEQMLDDVDPYAKHQAVLMLQESGHLDRQVVLLAAPDGRLRAEAEERIRRIIRVGQLGRIRELARSHATPAVRRALGDLLAEAPPSEART